MAEANAKEGALHFESVYKDHLFLFLHMAQGLLTGYPKNESDAWRNREGDAAVRIADGALFHLSAAKINKKEKTGRSATA